MDYNLKSKYGLEYEDFFSFIDNMYDEVIVYDDNYQIVYVNQASKRHYCCSPDKMIGKTFFDFVDEEWWDPSILPIVYKEKKTYAIKQKTYTDCELLTIAVPIFDEKNEIKYVVMNVRDNVNKRDLYNPDYSSESKMKDTNIKIIAESEEMKKIIKLSNKIASIDANCLITGESGTGKSYLAKYIHSISERKDGPFISVNCASLPNELVESELFGYEKGSFTGARSRGKIGLLEAANNGTILLDEISEFSLSAQAKLLNVIQNKEFFPVGSVKPKKVDVKIISATNKNLKNMIKAGTFREDLFYRLNVLNLYLPPLRKRKKDIYYLINHYFNHYCNKYDIRRQLTNEAIEVLINYQWKGNIRELRHVLERLVVTVDSLIIDVVHLPKYLFGIVDNENMLLNIDQKYSSLDKKVENYEKYIVIKAYEKYNTSRKLADYLSISQTKANNLIRKYIKK